MRRLGLRAGMLALMTSILPFGSAFAHCVVGNRFFPATLNVDDPCVADELSLPTISAFKTGDNPAGREVGISAVRVHAAPGTYHGLDVTIVTTDFGVRH